eukprot:CAMPEP_0178371624 /NCGR_PEP_ID=MMETSP0689_2-20121128/924_1 /TAXON_ID=160604 /ORGANISM="Amphidinium massartii, Strain CS-259" /LENGTH=313 /DNA_ID=CAMNT_0019991503 /DNA_START=29 /DNA_END=966 /DNA_ORIENTATION=-
MAAQASWACATLRASNVEQSVQFYTKALGMQLLHHSPQCALVGWPDRGALVELLAAPQHAAKQGWCSPDTRRDAFVWLGLANLPDVQASIDGLNKYPGCKTNARLQGQLVGDTGDIGFVGHFSDPDGYCLEALQDCMECDFVAPAKPPENTLRAEVPVLGQLKINSKQPEQLLRFYCEGLGMKLVNKMDISRFGLTLFFLAFTDEEPPEGLDSVRSRTWLWKAQFSQLEIQYWHSFEKDQALRIPPPEATLGFAGFTFVCEDPATAGARLKEYGASEATGAYSLETSILDAGAVRLLDPEARPLRLISRAAFA